jgi:hypothetical protein
MAEATFMDEKHTEQTSQTTGLAGKNSVRLKN